MPRNRIHFDPPRGAKRVRLIIGLVAAGALVVALFTYLGRPGEGEVPAAAVVAQLPSTQPNAPHPSGSAASRQLPLAAQAASAAESGPDRCAQAYDPKHVGMQERPGDAASLKAKNNLLNLLRARGDDVSLAMTYLIDEPNRAAASGELARLAHRTVEPAVMAMALTACRGEPHPDCRPLTSEAWHQRDPGSAWPLLQMASDAFQRGDEQAADSALRRAVKASWATSTGAIVPLFSIPAQDDDALIEKWELMGRAVAADSLVRSISGSVASRCRQRHVAGRTTLARPPSEALTGCRELAERLAVGPGFEDRFSAYTLGAVLGWPPERVAAVRDEMRGVQHFAMLNFNEPEARGCPELRKAIPEAQEFLTEGTMAATQRRMAAAGVTLGQMVESRRAADAAESPAYAAAKSASANRSK